jgi:hypothetical protein
MKEKLRFLGLDVHAETIVSDHLKTYFSEPQPAVS